MMLATTIAALAFALVGSFARGTVGTTAAGLAVVTVVAVPLLRVVVVGVHWLRIGDRRFAAVALAVLAVVGVGAILAL